MMIPMSRGADSAKTVIRISPLAHFASAFLSMALLTVGPAFGKAGLVLLAIPVLVSVVIAVAALNGREAIERTPPYTTR